MAPRDNSLLFSLREIEDLERDRISREKGEAEARRSAAERARLEREARAREEDARRVEEVAARMREEQSARREEAARLAAIERAAVEAARAEVEARARSEREVVQRAHEVELERARAMAANRRYRWLLVSSATATLVVGFFAATLSGKMRDLERVAADREAAALQAREACDRTASSLAGAARRVQALEAELGALRARPGAAAADPTRKPEFPTKRTTPGKPDGKPTTAGKRVCLDNGDPLDDCVPSH